MPTVKKLETFWNNKPGHDKIYILAIVLDDDGQTALVTASSPRTQVPRALTKYPPTPYADYEKIKSQKTSSVKGYSPCDWRDPKFATMRSFVVKLGTLPGQPAPSKPVAVQPVVAQPKPRVKAKEDAPLGRSAAAPRSFF